MGELSLVFVIIPNLKFDRNFILICFANTLQICADFFFGPNCQVFPPFLLLEARFNSSIGPSFDFPAQQF
jgi:hypothetical protein